VRRNDYKPDGIRFLRLSEIKYQSLLIYLCILPTPQHMKKNCIYYSQILIEKGLIYTLIQPKILSMKLFNLIINRHASDLYKTLLRANKNRYTYWNNAHAQIILPFFLKTVDKEHSYILTTHMHFELLSSSITGI
jgi:hypothetical protein